MLGLIGGALGVAPRGHRRALPPGRRRRPHHHQSHRHGRRARRGPRHRHRLRRLPGQPGRPPGPHRRSTKRIEAQEERETTCRPMTSRSTSRRRWTRFLGTGMTAFVAATAACSAAGAASPSNAPGGVSGSVAALSGSTMEVQNASTGQTTVDWTIVDAVLQDRDRVGELARAAETASRSRAPSKSSKTTITARTITVSSPSSTGSCTGRPARAAEALRPAGRSPGPGRIQIPYRWYRNNSGTPTQFPERVAPRGSRAWAPSPSRRAR